MEWGHCEASTHLAQVEATGRFWAVEGQLQPACGLGSLGHTDPTDRQGLQCMVLASQDLPLQMLLGELPRELTPWLLANPKLQVFVSQINAVCLTSHLCFS